MYTRILSFSFAAGKVPVTFYATTTVSCTGWKVGRGLAQRKKGRGMKEGKGEKEMGDKRGVSGRKTKARGSVYQNR